MIGDEVSEPENVGHMNWMHHLEMLFNKPGMRVLELGSRNVTYRNVRKNFSNADYVGFDYLDGPNVDVVGDAHKLSSYFKDDEKFDLVFSSAVFEHLYMPWVVSKEVSKVLKIGGSAFIETHFSFGSHERPWNFFQFSDMGLRVLFNRRLGFEILESGMSNRINGYFASEADEYLRFTPVSGLYCHSQILCRKVGEAEDFKWEELSPDDVASGTHYPAPR